MPVTVILRYEGTKDTRFDRDYYLNRHLPWARKEWEPWLVDMCAFFPASPRGEKGTICVFECIFKSEEALKEAFAAPCTPELMKDIPNYTDAVMTPGILGPFIA